MNVNTENCTDSTPPIYITEAYPLYACSTTIPAGIGAPIGTNSFKQSCSLDAGNTNLRYLFYVDTACQQPFGPTGVSNSYPQTCGLYESKYTANTYCVTNGNYQQYFPPSGDYLTRTFYDGGACSGSVTKYGAESLNSCLPIVFTPPTSVSLKQSDYNGYYDRYIYYNNDCSGEGVVEESFPYEGACSFVNGTCPNSNGGYYQLQSQITVLISAGGSDNDSSNVALGIGLGLGLGIPFMILVGVIYHFFYQKKK